MMLSSANKIIQVKANRRWRRARTLFGMLSVASLLACSDYYLDSFNKTPIQIKAATHKSNWFGEMDATDGTTRATFRIDSGYLGSSQCTLWIFSKFCNGTYRVRLGEDRSSFSVSTPLVLPAYCSDSTLTFQLMFVCNGLKPNTKYYFAAIGIWGPVAAYYKWQLDSNFTTLPDTSPTP